MTDSDIRTYRATTIHQALQMVEEELGRGAVILHTRQIEQRAGCRGRTSRGKWKSPPASAGPSPPILRRVSPSDHQFVLAPDEPATVDSPPSLRMAFQRM
ncbi:MAG: hypothetical protein Ct9H300mP1_00130 [Planctomycetaceae bacterium]|nr:MAG: hypothetical protein Ct9H300mP1_00130 [Planctomycetaceae bacterium]